MTAMPFRLLQPGISTRAAVMTARRSPAALLLGLLALLAVAQLSFLSTWHGASFHDDSSSHAAAVRHEHRETPDQDMDGTIHLAAHMLGQGINIPELSGDLVAIGPGAPIYGFIALVILSGRSPPSLLDPPRS